MGKTILVVGDISPDASRYTYATSFVRAFEQLGYTVHSFSPTKIKIISIVSVYIQKYYHMSDQRKLLRCASSFSPDIIFVLKGAWLSPYTLKALKSQTKAKLIHFYPDNPFTFWNGNSNTRVLACLPYWDCFLIWSKMLIEPLYSAGCKKVRYFPFAYDEEIFKPDTGISLLKKYKYDVSFIGTWEKKREQWLTGLKKYLPNLDLYIWGNGWHEHTFSGSVLYGSLQGRAIYGRELVQIMQSSKIVLNFLREQNRHAHNMRTFEVPALGAFLLTQRSKEQAKELFIENKSIACFGSGDELARKIAYFLFHEVERMSIAQEGYSISQRYTLTKTVAIFLKNSY